jgi:hypothetical protein
MPGHHQLTAATALLGALLCGLPAARGEDAGRRYRDGFAGGETELTWRPYTLYGDGVVEGRANERAPDGDGGIGVLRDKGGGPGTVSYAETQKAEDSFALGAQVYCPREGDGRDGALTGLAFFIDPGRSSDPEKGGFYRLVCDHRLGVAAFSIAYVGANIGRQPLELERWPLIEQPLPADGSPDWHQVEVRVDQGLIEVYLNGTKLNERPLPAERVITDVANVDAGYAGVYAGHIGEASPAEARIDGFVYRVP